MKTFHKTIAAFIVMLFAALLPMKAAAQACTTVPGNPTFTLGATAGTADITWSASTGFDGCVLSAYAMQVRVSSEDWPVYPGSLIAASSFPTGVTAVGVGGAFRVTTEGHGSFEPTTTGVTLSGLTAGTEYEMRMRSQANEGDLSAWSSPLTLTTAMETAQSTACLGAPRNVNFVVDTNAILAGNAVIAWDAATATGCTLTGYAVHVRLSTAAWDDTDAFESANSFPDDVSGFLGFDSDGGELLFDSDKSRYNAATFDIRLSGLTVGATYEVRTRAHESSGDTVSAWSPAVSHTVTEATVTAKPMTSDTITLTWTQSPTGSADYVRWRTLRTNDNAAGPWFSSDGADVVDCNAAVPTDCGGDESANYAGLEITGLASATDYEFQIVSVVGGAANLWAIVAGKSLSNDVGIVRFALGAGFGAESGNFLDLVPNVFEYNQPIGNDVTAVELQASKSDGNATVLMTVGAADPVMLPNDANTGPVQLGAAGTTTTIVFMVTAEDGVTTQDYTLNLIRAAGTENTLAKLGLLDDRITLGGIFTPVGTFIGTFTPEFEADSAVTQYDVAVPTEKSTAGIFVVATDPAATVRITPDKNSPLSLGDNEFTIKVTPSDGTSPARTVTLTITRPYPAALPGKLKLGVSLRINDATPHWEVSSAELVATNPYRLRWRASPNQLPSTATRSIGKWLPSAEGKALAGEGSSSCVAVAGVSNCRFAIITAAEFPETGAIIDFQVAAVGLYGIGEWSDIAEFQHVTIPAATPAVPTELAAAGGGELLATWTAPGTGTYTSFSLRWRTAEVAATDPDGTPGNADDTAAIPAGAWQGWIDAANPDNSPILGDSTLGVLTTDTSFRITNLTDDAAYNLQVRAHSGGRVGAWSDAITATPGAGDGDARLSGFGFASDAFYTPSPNNGQLVPAFDAEITEYKVYGDLRNFRFTPVPANSGASAVVTNFNGNVVNSIDSNITGREVLTITVTAADNVTTKIYTIDVETPAKAHTLIVRDANGVVLPTVPVQRSLAGSARGYAPEYIVPDIATTGSITVQTNYEDGRFGLRADGGANTHPVPTIGLKGGDKVDLFDNVQTPVTLAMGQNEIEMQFMVNITPAVPIPFVNTIVINRINTQSSVTALRALSVEADADANANPMIAGGFAAGKTEYDVLITEGDSGETATLTFTAATADATAAVTANPAVMTHARAPGIDAHVITVTAEDGGTQDYNFRLIRTANITAIAVKNADDDAAIDIGSVADTTFDYDGGMVAHAVSMIKVTPTFATLAPVRQIRINGAATDLAASAADNSVALDFGENTIELLFAGPASPNTKDPVIYTLKIARQLPPPPGMPGAPSDSDTGETGATLAWSAAADASEYHVRWQNSGIVPRTWLPDADGENVGNVLTYRVTGLNPRASYTTAVRAANAGGMSEWVEGAASIETIPADPIAFTTTASDVDEDAGALTLTVEISRDADFARDVAFTAAGATLTDDYTITASPVSINAAETTAEISVTLVDDAAVEADETLTITLIDGLGYSLAAANTAHTFTIRDNDVPAAITGLGGDAGASDDTFAWAAWDPPAGTLNANPYDLRWRVKSPLGAWTTKSGASIADEGDGGASCTSTYSITAGCRQGKMDGLAGPGVEYEFQVRANSAAGAGAWSALTTQANSGTAAAAPVAPTAITATAGEAGIALNWTPPAGTLNDYRIRYRTAATTDPVVAAAGAWQGWIDAADLTNSPVIGDDASETGFSIAQNTAGYTLAGLTGGMTFDIGVAAVAGEVVGAFEDTTATPLIAATLSSLDVSSFTFTPAFDAANLSYALTVPFATTAVTITSATDTADAAITVDGVAVTAAVTVTITDGDQIQIRVAADGFAAQTYIIGVTINARKQIDVTADGELDIDDAILIARYLLGIRGEDLIRGINTADGFADIETRIETEADAGSFNVDNDTANKTTAADAILIARYLLGVRGAGLTDGQVTQDINTVVANLEKLMTDAAQ